MSHVIYLGVLVVTEDHKTYVERGGGGKKAQVVMPTDKVKVSKGITYQTYPHTSKYEWYNWSLRV